MGLLARAVAATGIAFVLGAAAGRLTKGRRTGWGLALVTSFLTDIG
jgi:hypothetical protein